MKKASVKEIEIFDKLAEDWVNNHPCFPASLRLTAKRAVIEYLLNKEDKTMFTQRLSL